MPKLRPETQQARREHILDAAERCMANTGLHPTTMQDICRAAAISPGALYLHFESKEALIAGISERDRQAFAERLEALAGAPDFMQALRALGEQYFLETAAKDHRMSIDIGLEATRNPRVGEIFRRFDRYILDGFERLFHRLKQEGRIAPALDIGRNGGILHHHHRVPIGGQSGSRAQRRQGRRLANSLRVAAHD